MEYNNSKQNLSTLTLANPHERREPLYKKKKKKNKFVILESCKVIYLFKMNFNANFIMEMFLDDSVSTINRLIVATANVANEHFENMNFINNALYKEHNHIPHFTRKSSKSNDKEIKHKGNYYEDIIKHFTDYDYMNTFKINIYTVQALINYLKDFIPADNSIVPFDKKVHIFLYLIVSDLSFNEVGEKFGLHKSSVSYIFHEIANSICEQRCHFINWPSLEEQQVTSLKINSRFGFPNCVGFIDACRFKVGSKRKHNKKSNIILLQAVCDENLMFIDVYVGDVGNTKKNRVFKESPLAKDLKKFVSIENHVLGDSEYKLKNNLITPFPSSDTLSTEEKKFNEMHWNARAYIGHTFLMLKNRFTKVNHIDICSHDAVKTLIYAACVLHNFILLHEGNSQLKEETKVINDTITIDTNLVTTAAEKRQFLCNYINFIDNT